MIVTLIFDDDVCALCLPNTNYSNSNFTSRIIDDFNKTQLHLFLYHFLIIFITACWIVQCIPPDPVVLHRVAVPHREGEVVSATLTVADQERPVIVLYRSLEKYSLVECCTWPSRSFFSASRRLILPKYQLQTQKQITLNLH